MGRARLLVWGCAGLLASACAPGFSQDRTYFNDLGGAPGGIVTGSSPAATAALDAIRKARDSYGNKDQLLLGMDLGMANHVAGLYPRSEEIFRKTDRLSEKLFTQSFTNTVLAYQLNDYSLPYRGLPYERVMINLVNSLNYAETGDWSGALVEARKIREKLLLYNRSYASGTGSAPGKYGRYEGPARSLLSRHHIAYDPSHLNHYTDDAFARYLSGIYAEAQVQSGGSSYQSAYLSYKKAASVYAAYRTLYNTPVPSFIAPALLRTSEAAGRTNEFNKWRARYPNVAYTPASTYEKMGHLLFVGFNGQIFHLIQNRMVFPVPIAGTLSMISFSVPQPAGGTRNATNHEILVTTPSGAPVVRTRSELGDDLMAIGLTNFTDHLTRIVLREAIRAVLKTGEEIASQKIADQQGGILAELGAMVAGDIFAVASDQADIRSWRLLPATIDCSMVDLPPGTYDLTIQTRTGFGPGGRVTRRVTVAPGQYLLVRTVNPPPPAGN